MVWDLLIFIFGATLWVTLTFYLLSFYDQSIDAGFANPETDPPLFDPAATVMGVLREWWGLSLQVISYPLRLFYDFRRPTTAKLDRMPVLLVHGWGASSHSLAWIHWQLSKRGWPKVDAVSFFPPVSRIESLAKQVEQKIDQLAAISPNGKVLIVAHSMGGLISRYGLKKKGWGKKVAAVVTIGSPHAGTRLANIWVLKKGNVNQMKFGSEFLRGLLQGGYEQDTKVLSIYSTLDSFVTPFDSPRLPDSEGDNIQLNNLGHCALLYSSDVVNKADDFFTSVEKELFFNNEGAQELPVDEPVIVKSVDVK